MIGKNPFPYLEDYFVWVKTNGEVVFADNVPESIRQRFLKDHAEYETQKTKAMFGVDKLTH